MFGITDLKRPTKNYVVDRSKTYTKVEDADAHAERLGVIYDVPVRRGKPR